MRPTASDLTEREQRAVRTTLRFLRGRAGSWKPVAKALRAQPNTISKVSCGSRIVTAQLALRVARLVEVGVDDLLAGRHLLPRTCRHCGRPPEEDFGDEETVVEDQLRGAVLNLVR